MKIHFVDELPNQLQRIKNIHYCHFKHQDLKLPDTNYIDLKSLAAIHEKSFFKDIEKWHSEINLLGLKQSKYWWFTSNSRLMSWAPPIFTPLFFHYLLQIAAKEKKLQEIYVLSAPKEVIDLAPDFFTDISVNMSNPQIHVDTKSFFDNHLRPYLAYLKNYLFNQLEKKSLEKRPYLIHSLLLNADNLLNGNDHFFGSIFFNLSEEKRKEITWIFHYPKNDKKIKIKVVEFFASKGFQVVFSYDFFNIIEIMGLFFKSIQLKKSIKAVSIKMKNGISSSFNQMYAQKILNQKQDSLIEFETYQALGKVLPILSPDKILFAYEERSIERAILLANNEQETPAKTYGFVHSVMHQGHLCFDLKYSSEANPPRPNKILTTGVAAKEWFEAKGYSANDIEIFGSPRSSVNFKEITEIKKPIKILFVVGQPHEIMEFATMLKAKPTLLKGFELTVRRYPYGWPEDQNKGIDLLNTIYPNLNKSVGNLHQQLETHDIVFFSSSSAGLEAICNGKLSIHISLDQFHNLDPLEYAKTAKSLISCRNIVELENTLNRITNLSVNEWNDLVQNQITDAKLIYDSVKIEKFIDS